MRVINIVLCGLASVLLIVGCNSADSVQGINENGDTYEPVSLMKATSEDISANIVDCKSEKNHKKKGKRPEQKQVCLAICHKPPGNPDNSKSKVLPMSAVLAHLEHGGPHHGEHDHLGLCDGDGEEDMEDVDPDDPTYGNGDADDDSSGSDGDDGGSDDSADDSNAGSDDSGSCEDGDHHNDGDGAGSDDGSATDDGSTSDDGSATDDGSTSDDGSATDDGSTSDDGSATDDGSTSDDGSTTDDNSGLDADHGDDGLPQYCSDNLDLDADCDGIVDSTGDWMY